MNPSDSGKVNTILHNLRGEQFRHSQNIQGSRIQVHLRAGLIHNSPTLPFKLHDHGIAATEAESTAEMPQTWSGPKPPKSWRMEITSAMRANMLSLLLSVSSQASVPSLTLLCLRRISSMPTNEFIHDIIPFVPPHLRCQLLRDTALHFPLPNPKLYALCEPEGTADGELIIVGPTQSLHNGFFLHSAREGAYQTAWDEEEWSPSPLHTFILLSTPLSTSTLLTLSPTITHMALINLPNALPLHRLPGICPLLVVLDLSYNVWLHLASKEATKILDRVQWNRWTHLRKLGFRDCYVYDGLLAKLNQGKWDDVQVVLT
ncbi:uncharacterized protein BT62DRAFT_1074446 [Guyanagaster necrorhizus]|uniref:Uncharacterized protein n=1 Tax=Guyanagaster necrorhizus TaxID=856835 RepID=A0A9P7VWM9_9AGAR|nr:uncharacterized protein BT62DRAFT_1074446 [Guyanagaster necrorhizus MCA 3950]KAG7447912.1 hypothetical protein BT62DRAFT_1074446 [Guyanagaster necrorhizus MCA 3950]